MRGSEIMAGKQARRVWWEQQRVAPTGFPSMKPSICMRRRTCQSSITPNTTYATPPPLLVPYTPIHKKRKTQSEKDFRRAFADGGCGVLTCSNVTKLQRNKGGFAYRIERVDKRLADCSRQAAAYESSCQAQHTGLCRCVWIGGVGRLAEKRDFLRV
jgi:hypothetical protein